MTLRTLMREEIEQIPAIVARIMDADLRNIERAGHEMRALEPRVLISVARGSSDHAAHFLKYAAELLLGIPVASVGPSIASVYGGNLAAERAVCLAISQSGRSPDILALTEMLQKNGASVISLVNDISSPLAKTSLTAIDVLAGPERSVPATKSFVATLVSGLALLAHCAGENRLIDALGKLPEQLAKALDTDWSELARAMQSGGPVFVLGRGPGLAIAGEAALKLKETCGLHAEAYSTAEVRHGPIEVISSRFTSLCFAVNDAAAPGVVDCRDLMAKLGAASFMASTNHGNGQLNAVPTLHPLTDFIGLIVSFYAMAEKLSLGMGRDPDHPAALRKVTETI
jgi:glutamine---fructose-6-phosphate transaminase (isomerizing)